MDFMQACIHPTELYNLMKYRFGGGRHVIPKQDLDSLIPSARTCYSHLQRTSRSFAAVIQALDGDLRHAVCIFYLVLRALDTVEDDMTISIEEKIPLLQTFYQKLEIVGWNYSKSNEKDKIVLEDFALISQEYRGLAEGYRVVISDITRKMGNGMSEFIQREVITMADWDLYCHYVAGLVGIGLSKLFSASGFEDEIVGKDTALANSMGLFLQKTNIIRDYLEDTLEDRNFWPKEAWTKYASKLCDFQKPENLEMGVNCLNELITNAIHHIPDVLMYMSRLKNQSVFHFCGIPQVMAAATLARCYNNQKVLSGVVKIRRGETVGLMMASTNMKNLKEMMHEYAKEISSKIPSSDPNFMTAHHINRVICDLSRPRTQKNKRFHQYQIVSVIVALLFIVIISNWIMV